MNSHSRNELDYESFLEALSFEEALNKLTSHELDEVLNMLGEETVSPLRPPRPVPESEPESPPLRRPEPKSEPKPEPVIESGSAPKSAKDGWRELYDWIRALATAFVFVGIVSVFLVRIIGVSGDSMNPTLQDGERLLVSNLFYRPQPGDIVIFAEKSYADQQDQPEDSDPLVKRIIAVEGQTVDIDFQFGQVTVDGVVQQEPYILEPTTRYGDIAFPFTVPSGCLFVMGDNRNNSMDSRFSPVGPVDARYVLGRVLLRVWPPSDWGVVS